MTLEASTGKIRRQTLACHLCAAEGRSTIFTYSTPRQPGDGKRVVVRDAETAAAYGLAVDSAVALCPDHASHYDDARAAAPKGRSTRTSARDALRYAAER